MADVVDDFSQWIGRTEVVEDDVSPATAQAAAVTFDEGAVQFRTGVELPPLWHWFYFLHKSPQSQLGSDGHSQRATSSFMPPIPLPRRMFAGARLTWHRPLVVGRTARREAVIRDVVRKSGRSGELAFITVAYRYFQGESAAGSRELSHPSGRPQNLSENRRGLAHFAESSEQNVPVPLSSQGFRIGSELECLCIEEEQDIVYREQGSPIPPPEVGELPDVPPEAWSRVVVPDTRLLFRFSALTFNAHRIHYDRPYAIDEEGYPGLVVHGPLAAMLLLKLARENTSQTIVSFNFRGKAPLFDFAPFRLVGIPQNGRVELQAQGPDSKTTMIATAEFAS